MPAHLDLHSTKGNAMNLFRWLPILFVAVSGIALADHDHAHSHGHGENPMHGGVVTEVKGVDYELVVKPDSIQLHLRIHGNPIAVAGGSARATVLVGAEKQEVELKPVGERFEYSGAVKATKGAKVVVVVNLPGKPAATARFVLK
jgi:hypothetical protein